MKMRRAITRTRSTRVTAEGDGFVLFLAAIGIATIAGLKLDQGEMARFDISTTQFRLGHLVKHRQRPVGPGQRRFNATRLVNFLQRGWLSWQQGVWPFVPGNSQSPGAADRSVARIGRPERRVDPLDGLRKRNSPGEMFPQRLRMFGRPVYLLHSAPASCRRPTPPQFLIFRNKSQA